MKNRDIYWRRYKIEQTLDIEQWYLSPLQSGTLEPQCNSPSLFHCSKHSATSFVGIVSSCPVTFSWISSLLFPSWIYFWEKPDFGGGQIWLIGYSLNQVISNCNTMFFYSGSRSRGTNFATTCFMLRYCSEISDTIIFGIPRSASSSCTVSHWSLLILSLIHISEPTRH